MRNTVKAEIVKSEKSFHKDGYLTLKLSGDNHEEVKNFVRLRKLGPGNVVLFKLDDKESKSYRQLKTVHLLLRIYQDSDLSGAKNIDDLKNRVKYQYGIIEYWEAPDGKIIATLKSFADYKMSEIAPVITGLMDEMNKVFYESDYSDRRFSEMLVEFNSQEIKKDADELF